MVQQAKNLLEAYERSCGVGHTSIAVKAAEEYGAILVVHTEHYGRELAKAGARCEIAPIWHLTQHVWGKHKPLILDNAVIIELATEAVCLDKQLAVCLERQRKLALRNAQLEREALAVQEQSDLLARYPGWWRWVGRQLVKSQRGR